MTEQRRRGKYPAEMRERAVRMVLEHQHEYGPSVSTSGEADRAAETLS